MTISQRFQLIKPDLIKIGIGAVIALSGALLTYLSQVVTTINFGAYSPLVVMFWSIVANACWKYIKTTAYKNNDESLLPPEQQ